MHRGQAVTLKQQSHHIVCLIITGVIEGCQYDSLQWLQWWPSNQCDDLYVHWPMLSWSFQIHYPCLCLHFTLFFFHLTVLSPSVQYDVLLMVLLMWWAGRVSTCRPEHMAVLKCSWHGLWRASQRWGGTDLNSRTSGWTNTGRLRRKWPQFWHFLMHFLEWKFLYIDSNFN